MIGEATVNMNNYGSVKVDIDYSDGRKISYDARPHLAEDGDRNFQFHAFGDGDNRHYHLFLVVSRKLVIGSYKLNDDRDRIFAMVDFPHSPVQEHITQGWVNLTEVGEYPKGSFEYVGEKFKATGSFAFKGNK